MFGTAAAASAVFTVMRTTSDPASASALTCSTVARISAVSVLVIDCTTIGASLPIATLSTRTSRVRRRAMFECPAMLIASRQAQPRDVLARVWREIDWLPAITQPHYCGVANDDVEGRGAVNRLLGAGGHQASDKQLAIA